MPRKLADVADVQQQSALQQISDQQLPLLCTAALCNDRSRQLSTLDFAKDRDAALHSVTLLGGFIKAATALLLGAPPEPAAAEAALPQDLLRTSVSVILNRSCINMFLSVLVVCQCCWCLDPCLPASQPDGNIKHPIDKWASNRLRTFCAAPPEIFGPPEAASTLSNLPA